MKKLIYILALTFGTASYSATPFDLAQKAEERAPLIQMSLEKKSMARSEVSQSQLLPNPIVSVQSGTLKSGTANGSVIDLTLNQPIPWPGKKTALIQSAKILEKLSEYDIEEAKLRIHHSVSLMATELAVMNELEKHNAERKHRFSLIHHYLSSHPLASPKQKIEKDLIETQMSLVESQMYDLETRILSFKEQLQMLTGENDIKIKLNWEIPSPPEKELFLEKIKNNVDFKRSEKSVELAKNQIEEAKFYAKPDLLVGVNYRRENVAPTNHFYHANLSVVIPILDRGQHSIEAARARARLESASRDLTLLDSTISLNRYYQSLVSSYRSTRLFQITKIASAEKRFLSAEKSFMKGQIDVATFLQTDTQIHESIDTAYTSYLRYYSSLSDVKLLIGEKLEVK